MSRLDPRLHPYRPDLAAAHLRGAVGAPRYAEGAPAQVWVGRAALRRHPADDAPMDTEILFGEAFTVYESRDGWAWGQAALDSYVGYVRADALGPAGPEPDARVAVPRTFLYPQPDIKTPPLAALPMNAKLVVAGEEGRFVRLATGGFAFAAHVVPLHRHEPDFVAVAELFLGAPYLWGGKTWAGLDCSGLVQIALEAAGVAAPRDSDLQTAMPGEEVRLNEARRGDLVFWKGHVGILLDPETLLHANAHHMQAAREPLDEARNRILRAGLDVLAVLRPRP